MVAAAVASLNAAPLNILLDHRGSVKIDIDENLPPWRQEDPSGSYVVSPVFEKVTLENIGDAVVRGCFPAVGTRAPLTLTALTKRLERENDPALALYRLWRGSVRVTASTAHDSAHPLDLLNFIGECSPAAFEAQFISLCSLLGIEVKAAPVQGRPCFDLRAEEEPFYLDIKTGEHFVDLSNTCLASSDHVIDDPLVLLRAKVGRDKNSDFNAGWSHLAAYRMIDALSPHGAASFETMPSQIAVREKRSSGFDLYPREKVELSPSQEGSVSITHTLNLNGRCKRKELNYASPFPIRRIVNTSSSALILGDKTVEPGESLLLDENVFTLKGKFAKAPKGALEVVGSLTAQLFPGLSAGFNRLTLGIKENPSVIAWTYELKEVRQEAGVRVNNRETCFDHCAPYFLLETNGDEAEKIWWQIGLDNEFSVVPSTLDQVEEFSPLITLSPIAETFLNDSTPYYFRVKGLKEGQWSDWSSTFVFTVRKPLSVENITFEPLEGDRFLLDWEREGQNEEGVEYLIFASNAIDFIPSIYYEKQVNAIVNGTVTEEETTDNLIAITRDKHYEVSGHLPFIRVIARKEGQLSPPSSLVHIYGTDLVAPRSVLQKRDGSEDAVRMLLPSAYSWKQNALPFVSNIAREEGSSFQLERLLRAAKGVSLEKYTYQYPDVPNDVWNEVRPYLLPDGHPAWPKLNKIFCKTRATQTPEHFKKAGFRRWRPGRWSRVAASSNPECAEYFIKAYCDNETGVIYDWKKWIHRIRGAETIRECIKRNNIGRSFKVPHKWIYPLPKEPSPPNTRYYVRKNFVLVCENMRIQEHSTNERMYKHDITKELMNGLYTILQECGLNDSVYVFNMPFCKDGKIAIIDTEYHHKWPVPFQKLTSYFPSSLRSYWQRLTFNGGKIPPGIPEHNPPRMDRRDVR